jgi:hypothetical protein
MKAKRLKACISETQLARVVRVPFFHNFRRMSDATGIFPAGRLAGMTLRFERVRILPMKRSLK